MLEENAAKIYEWMSKNLADEILNYFPTSKPPQPDLLPLPSLANDSIFFGPSSGQSKYSGQRRS